MSETDNRDGLPVKITPVLIHRTFILARIDSALGYLQMARSAYEQNYPDAVIMALDLADSDAVAARGRVIAEHDDRKSDGQE